MRYFRALRKYIGFSIAVHLVLALLISRVPVPDHPIVKQPSYVDLLETPELPTRPLQTSKDDQQFVRKAQAPQNLLTDEDKKARFASEDDQNVIEERKARENGMTTNRANDGRREEQQYSQGRQRQPGKRSTARNKLNFAPEPLLERAKEQLKIEGSEYGDVKVGGVVERKPAQAGDDGESRPLQFPGVASAEQGTSTLGEALPDSIEFGDFTALNTDRHTYYAFYARMEEQTRHRWEAYARAAIFDATPEVRDQLTRKEYWTTKLEIILDREGRFQRAIIRESSGLRTLDAAPVQAFRDAYQFPNPPEGLVKDDGLIHIMYAFSVNISSRLASN